MLDKKTIAAVFGFESEAKFNEGTTTPAEAGKGGEDNWGADCNVSLNAKQKYLVILRGYQKLDLPKMAAERLERMANNLVIMARPVTITKGRITVTGTPFTALVGGRALCQAGISDANSKNKARKEGTPVLLSFVSEDIPEDKRTEDQKAAGITSKKVYSASRLTSVQEEDVKAALAAEK